MYPRTEYEMTEADFAALLEACKPTVAIMVGGSGPSSPQENANRAWAALGAKMGFDHMTVRPVSGKGERFFTAVPSETPEQKIERLKRERQAMRDEMVAKHEAAIREHQEALDRLKSSEA